MKMSDNEKEKKKVNGEGYHIKQWHTLRVVSDNSDILCVSSIIIVTQQPHPLYTAAST